MEGTQAQVILAFFLQRRNIAPDNILNDNPASYQIKRFRLNIQSNTVKNIFLHRLRVNGNNSYISGYKPESHYQIFTTESLPGYPYESMVQILNLFFYLLL